MSATAKSGSLPAGQGDDVDNFVAKPAEHAPSSPSPSPPRRRRRRALPAWLNHFNPNDLKVTFRCWAAVWVAMLLIFISPSLHDIGQSTFFAAIVLFIVPPAGILMVYLLASLSLLVGMCLAWSWGLLAMKAAFAVRSDAEMLGLVQSLRQQAAAVANQTGQPPAAVSSKLVYDGFFLDARVVAIYYVMCCAFIYALARLRYANAKLILLQIFGTIVIDVFLVTGPILTQFNAKLAQILVKPAAIGAALGVASSVLIFPQSTSYVLLSQMEQLIRLLEAPLDSTRRLLSDGALPDDVKLRASKGAIIGISKAMGPALAFLPLDLSRGRWNTDDVKSLHGRVREAVLASLFLLDFHLARAPATAQIERLGAKLATKTVSSTTPEGAPPASNGVDLTFEVVDAMMSPEQSPLRPGLLGAVQATTAEVLQVNSRAIRLAAETVHIVNTSRWYQSASSKTRLQRLLPELREVQAQLRTARDTYVVDTNEAVIKVHADLFDEQGRLKDRGGSNPLTLNGLIVAMVLEERIANAAATTEELLGYMVQLLEIRTQQRIWLPTRLRYALSWLTSRDTAAPVPGASTDAAVDPDEVKAQMQTQMEDAHHRLRMVSKGNKGVRAPKKRGILTRAVVGTYRWLFNSGGVYALRMVVVTIALGIPASLTPTAGFVYRQKGIWALIMAQTCLLMYMADFTFSLVTRGLGTVIGGVLGMVAWYAGSGSGAGNPYGMAATTAVISAMLMWWRLYLPPALAQASIMTASTFVLIVGYSWDQYHIAQYGLPGVGYEAFWKRLVLVLIGFAAAFIVQIFPKPPSATRYVCKSLANNVRSLSDHYALLISQWSHHCRDQQQQQQQQQKKKNAGAAVAAEQITFKVAEDLEGLTGAISLLKVEISTTPFDQAILLSTRNKCETMNQTLGKLLVLSANLPHDLQKRLGQNAGLVEPRSVSSVMSVLSIVEYSLRTGTPLPERLPVPLVETCFLEWYQHHERAELTVELVRSQAYRQYCVAVSAYLSFLATVDDVVEDLKATLGETHVVHQWEDEEV
ncbi:hypothetical protein E4U42_005374 [Claviceps africana]|uniref:ER transporter 6TM N-terminal domain-containing protein n=1 Tax=Claviceps africana TaxID=83212 RepID=A0A8K0J3Q5_9HYPO|nr:hypothetical protein E4U42_005374 [Claviceps africana]